MTAVVSEFRQAVSKEANLVQQFVELLEQEQEVLTKGLTDELPAIAESKEKLAAELNELSRQRNALLVSLGFPTDRPGMEAWATANPLQKETIAAWSQTLSLAARAKNLNLRNGQLIQLRMKDNAQALEILMRKENNLDLYGPDGRSSAPGERRIDDAV
jgi:flagella synthesis protein FlgN